MAGERQLAGEREDVSRNLGRVHDLEFGQGQGAGLVEDDTIGLGEPLDGIARVEQDAGAKHRAGRDRLHGGDRQPERAGTGDDENGNAGDDGIVPARADQDPADHGEQRRGVHHRRIKPRGAVGKPHIARARLQRIVEQPGDLRQQRAFGGGRDPDPQGSGDVERTGIDRGALFRRNIKRLAGDQALVDLRTSLDHGAVDRAALAGAQQHDIAGMDRRHRHLGNFVGALRIWSRSRPSAPRDFRPPPGSCAACSDRG